MPDYRPKGLVQRIEPKCRVIYFPIKLPVLDKPIHTQDQEIKGDNSSTICSINGTDRIQVPLKKFKLSSECFEGGSNNKVYSQDNVDMKIKFPVNDSQSESLDGKCLQRNLASEAVEGREHENNLTAMKGEVVESDTKGSNSSTTKTGHSNYGQVNVPLHIVWAHRW